ncbi:MAG: AsnC family transcriptional regulator [Pseudodesulfovibrio sp.]|uniref:siroheme decarboxylase n=1 Tax=Pseudodesulfovibrio aespoeensis (strain ATCC 700646 / DSM 10631 / Aspo-2) TaxID=643562 RepID=E6VSW9_PSEA9|nr:MULTISPECIES: AsnC family transcriptional regulator [Pseudodesulfovibrio]MBU4193155.1 AsnC family transcriptional regulator [Pseudomonadota bacterium]ADU63213.1 putative transcriptional regulator, AsnC family [Pseudodesulfovibrio aespoeensis Aspo-2]MBU4243277.1 AsnC family transcriptional regulator [Pseudomonadota bacterium]MBU4379162.1 AsnC family transcriptional regulator [Pseudomonadota bacterium]MBU4475110.1 AsnC family transcriptional regulator [Pseudomonadota bacterium]
MDSYDKRILDIIQSHFPLVSRPYDEVGRQVGLSGDEVLVRVREMKKSGLIRRMGANFNSHTLGWQSTLCAASVPEDRLDAFVAEVNKHDGVTHNYLRENEYNVWFALIAPDMDAVEAILASITEATGIKILNLPASTLFKIKVDFKMDK